MAEWLRRGLQILARRFDSGSGLQTCSPDFMASFPTPGIAPFPDGKLTMGGIQRNSDGLPQRQRAAPCGTALPRSEQHTPELQSIMRTSYAVSCLKTKK